MKAMILSSTVLLSDNDRPLQMVELNTPVPGERQILIRVLVCGVCHTELDEIEGRTAPPVLPVVPGHEVVGRIEALGQNASQFKMGDRVGVGWIHSSSGDVDENLSPEFRATGRDVNGGYAEYMVVGEDYAYAIPEQFSDEEAAPLLCAGAVGYRSLKLTNIVDGDVLGLTGFGGSGHLVLQMARHLYPDSKIFVFARSSKEREFAMELGATWSGNTTDSPPERPHAIIDTTPAWQPVLSALENLRPGGRLIINAIRKESGDRELMAGISYERHLWLEKEVKSVANVTRSDLQAFLPLAAEIPLKPEVEVYPLEDANKALLDLQSGHVRGAKVLRISS
jgi:alcohol dehydrogenase, propanol-preferring